MLKNITWGLFLFKVLTCRGLQGGVYLFFAFVGGLV